MIARAASAAMSIFAFAVLIVLMLGSAGAAETIATLKISGAGGHRASGTVEIVRDGELRKIVFKDDFVLRDAPDPKLAWGRNGYTRGTIFAKLSRLKGGQEYEIPASVKLEDFNEFWLWCERYDAPLAVAKLKP